jgi:hypothetical protein
VRLTRTTPSAGGVRGPCTGVERAGGDARATRPESLEYTRVARSDMSLAVIATAYPTGVPPPLANRTVPVC